MRALTSTDRVLPWLVRILWVAVLVAGGPAIDGALADESGTVADAIRIVAIAGWVVGVVAMAVPAVLSLTALRIVVPAAVPVAVVTLAAGAATGDGAVFLAVSLVATTVALSADLGRVFVQASAYGDEDRHVLRPPLGYAVASVATWAVGVGAGIAATLLLVHERWLIGAVVGVVAAAVTALGCPRWHRLSRRWLVIMPIGVVVHDQVVLAETILLRRQEIAGLYLAPADTEAADLTGPAAGHAIEITTVEPTTAILAATPRQPRGTAIHLRACLVAPSRPGRALGAARARRLPVG